MVNCNRARQSQLRKSSYTLELIRLSSRDRTLESESDYQSWFYKHTNINRKYLKGWSTWNVKAGSLTRV